MFGLVVMVLVVVEGSFLLFVVSVVGIVRCRLVRLRVGMFFVGIVMSRAILARNRRGHGNLTSQADFADERGFRQEKFFRAELLVL